MNKNISTKVDRATLWSIERFWVDVNRVTLLSSAIRFTCKLHMSILFLLNLEPTPCFWFQMIIAPSS
jgi:hypothetical protein